MIKNRADRPWHCPDELPPADWVAAVRSLPALSPPAGGTAGPGV